MISAEQWQVLAPFRTGIEAEYTRSVLGKPERLPAYADTLTVLQDALDNYSLDRRDAEQVYALVAGIVSTINFINQYFNVVCNDPHMMSHLGEAVVFMGYLVRELCYGVDAPLVTAEA